jgi:hypothetical protein
LDSADLKIVDFSPYCKLIGQCCMILLGYVSHKGEKSIVFEFAGTKSKQKNLQGLKLYLNLLNFKPYGTSYISVSFNTHVVVYRVDTKLNQINTNI